jgi:hypothetical protein
VTIRVEQFDYDLVEQYFLKNLLENDFWLFGSHAFEEEKPTSIRSSAESRQFLEKTIFGTTFAPTDFSFMIPFRDWEEGTIYTQYDDTVELKDTPYYVTIEPDGESGNYHIFKCISNNNGSPSTQKPEFNQVITEGIYFLSDGYIWKFMTSTPFSLFQKFASRGLIPIARNQQVEDNASEGIFNIVVENPLENFGYERITAKVSASEQIQDGAVTRIFLKETFSETAGQIPIFDIQGTYTNKALYIKKSNSGVGIGAIEATIISSGIISGIPFVTIATPSGLEIEVGDFIEILPKVEIQGNGISASGVAIFDSVNLRIIDILILNVGDNYSSASARIIDPVSFDPNNPNRQDVRAILRPIISPVGGHGANVLSELKSSQIGLSKVIDSTSPSIIPSSGFYSKVGLVKNPVFESSFSDATFDNRIKMVLSFIPGNMNVGDEVSQGQVRGIVHEIDVSTDTIFIAEYDGPYNEIFVVNQPLRHRNINYVINSIDNSPYESRSGDVLTISDLTPIERSTDRSEQIKIILDF